MFLVFEIIQLYLIQNTILVQTFKKISLYNIKYLIFVKLKLIKFVNNLLISFF